MFFKRKEKESIELPPMPKDLPKSIEEADVINEEIPEKIPNLGEPIGKPKSLISEIEQYKDLEVPELEEKIELPLKKESFVKIENFRELSDNIALIKDMLNETADRVDKTIDSKNIEDSALESWQASLKDIGKRLVEVDESLFGKVTK